MAKYKPYNYDQMVMVPISLENQLEPGTLEYTINELVEKNIDLTVFEGRYQNDETGATAINSKSLLKVSLFAYSRGMISSRQIERACGENILFMPLSCGYTCTAPNAVRCKCRPDQHDCPFCVLHAGGGGGHLQQHLAGAHADELDDSLIMH
jgi:hypothetical protein